MINGQFNFFQSFIFHLVMNFDLEQLEAEYRKIEKSFPKENERKIYFLSVCKLLDKSLNLNLVNEKIPHGGKIGIGDSYLDLILGNFKFFRLHAVFHDAFGFVKDFSGLGTGYCYMIPNFPINFCLLGHITGLIYCLLLKFLHPAEYNRLNL